MAGDRSLEKVEAIIADYLSMLAMDLSALNFNKSEHRRNLQKLLNNRVPGCVGISRMLRNA